MIEKVEDELPLADADSKNIIISYRTHLARKIKARNRLHIGSEDIGHDFLGLILPKGSPLLRPFNIMYLSFFIYLLYLLSIKISFLY